MKAQRNQPVYPLLAPFLRKNNLPDHEDLFSIENVEYALLCLEQESFDEVYRNSIIKTQAPISTGDERLDEIEKAFAEGADLNDLIKQLK